MTSFFSASPAIGSITINSTSNDVTYFPAGTGSGVGYTVRHEISSPNVKAGIESSSNKEISPSLYFKFVKSKLTKSQQKKLEADVAALRAGIESAGLLKQQGLYEALQQELAIVLHQMLCRVHSYDRFVMQEDIDKFMSRVEGRKICFRPLAEFPRPVPDLQKKLIAEAMEKKLFDQVVVLYIEGKSEEKIKSTEKKIREKDPIAFGRLNIPGSPLYYICDWVDDFCDLTLDQFISKMKLVDPEYHVRDLKPISDKETAALIARVKLRHDRLKNTNSQNWRLMANLEMAENGKVILTWAGLKDVVVTLWRAAWNRVAMRFRKKGL